MLSQKKCTNIIPITNIFGYIETSTNCLIERHQIIYDFVTALDINICHTHGFGEWLLLINAAAAFYFIYSRCAVLSFCNANEYVFI